jgi:Nickel responsive protein SCO4226-like
VATYLVERYLPDLTVDDLQAAIQRIAPATEEMTAEGTPVRYVGSAFVPDDEACFCQFEAPSAEAVAEANRRARFPFARIVVIESVRAQASGRVMP